VIHWETRREAAVTFGWEVGFALGFVRPVHHQVAVATETVGDFICEMDGNRRKGSFKDVKMPSCEMRPLSSTRSRRRRRSSARRVPVSCGGGSL